jgi:enoyl-CoA hydratase
MSNTEEALDKGKLEATAADNEFVDIAVGDRAEHVATVTINRPEAKNAMNATVRSELKEALQAIEDSTVRAVVLTGGEEGDAFVAGADVEELRERSALEQREVSKRPRVYEMVDQLRQPVIARINGHALGGGSELALACDIRIARRNAKMGQPEINLGFIPGGGATQRLPRIVGEGQAMRLILSGEMISTDEAERIGLVDEVLDPGEFDDRIYELAEKIASKSPVALEFAKQAVRSASRMDLEQGIEYEVELFVQLFGTEDKNEGIDAFFEGRSPEWKGR